MTTLNLNNAAKLYYGSTEVQKLYQGNQLLYPITNSSSLYWRVDYNAILAEIQVSFEGSHTPLVLDSSNNIQFSRLGTPFSTVTNPQYSVGALNNNLYTVSEYIGSVSSNENHAYQILLNTAKTITSLWLACQQGGIVIYNAPTYLKLFNSINGNTWNLVKEWTVSDLNRPSSITSPYSQTLLRPNQLVEFIV